MISYHPEQRILVTGASSGIGKATALLLNALGATVIANGRDAQRLEQTQNAAVHPECLHLAPRDLEEEIDGLPAWVTGLCAQYGRLHGLAFCAGKTWNAPLSTYQATQAQAAFALCCHAPLLVARAFCDKRNNTGPGAALVCIAAAAATAPNPGQGMYGAAKAALVNGVLCLSKEIARRGLRANCISPGLVATPMMDVTVAQLGAAFLERERALYPLGFGTPEDVAHTAAFLLSDKARWLTGQNIVLAGGR